MTHTHPIQNLAIIGNGTTAVNALHYLLVNHGHATSGLTIDLYGAGPEETCGRGFAYGSIGGQYGNLTESPAHGHADYQTAAQAKTAFKTYAAQALGGQRGEVLHASRSLVGDFHADRYREVRALAEQHGITLRYHQALVDDIDHNQNGYFIKTGDNSVTQKFSHVVVAVGDILSTRFNALAAQHPGQVFITPYHGAIETISKDQRENAVVVAYGTRSSFLDLVNASIENGFKGHIVGVSRTGQTSWSARAGRKAYPLRYLHDHTRGLVEHVFDDVFAELRSAQAQGVFVPEDLVEAVRLKASGRSSPRTRVEWDYDLTKEIPHASKTTYRDVIASAPWEKIYAGLYDDDKSSFTQSLGDLVLWSRVNRVTPYDAERFFGHHRHGRFRIVKDSFLPNSITSAENGTLRVQLNHGLPITADYVVNCAIGPVSAEEQIAHHTLLGNIARKGWITPCSGGGSGFDVTTGHDITLLGAQGRRHPFSSLGIESYGRQIEAWGQDIVPRLPGIPSSPCRALTL